MANSESADPKKNPANTPGAPPPLRRWLRLLLRAGLFSLMFAAALAGSWALRYHFGDDEVPIDTASAPAHVPA
jgi:hypothetical protein